MSVNASEGDKLYQEGGDNISPRNWYDWDSLPHLGANQSATEEQGQQFSPYNLHSSWDDVSAEGESSAGHQQDVVNLTSFNPSDDLSELQHLAKSFKDRRIKLGYSLIAVSSEMKRRCGPGFSQTTLETFETSGTLINSKKRLLLKWLQEMEMTVSGAASASDVTAQFDVPKNKAADKCKRGRPIKTTRTNNSRQNYARRSERLTSVAGFDANLPDPANK